MTAEQYMPLDQARQVLSEHPELARAYRSAVRASHVKQEHRDTIKRASAYLVCSGWHERAKRMIPQATAKTKPKLIRQLANDAVADLQIVDLLPTGIAWWRMRRGTIGFIRQLIDRWLFQ